MRIKRKFDVLYAPFTSSYHKTTQHHNPQNLLESISALKTSNLASELLISYANNGFVSGIG
jgi:hypothetical protein